MTRANILLLLLGLFWAKQTTAQDIRYVSARSFFAQRNNCDRDRPILIQIVAPVRLLFDAQDNKEYVLGGCSLHIVAKTVALRGDVVVSAFDPSFHPANSLFVPAQGSHGEDFYGGNGGAGLGGVPGETGVDAGSVTLDIENLEGTGTLTVLNSGSPGGRGGNGGNGGDGGRGRNGIARTCGDIFGRGAHLPGDGGPGGAAGQPGRGGPGGKGGNGGPIYFNPRLDSFISNGRLRTKSSPGKGGMGGAPGEPGQPGQPGEAGSGGACGAGGQPGPPGAQSPLSVSGQPGINGNAGILRDKNYAVVEVLYATDRKRQATNRYEGERSESGRLSLGSCAVSVPIGHRLGMLETPSVWKLEFRGDPQRHIVLLSTIEEPYDEFYGRLSSALALSKKTEALVFVHGYNVPFEEAIRRSAQLAVDLNFDGPVIAYSWPSAAAQEKYPTDESTIEWTAPHLRWFLEDMSRRTNAKTAVHVIAHSMGNRALISAMRSMVLELRGDQRPHFDQIVLAAPDVDTGVFANIIQAIRSAAERITLYVSSRDRALQLSKNFHTYPRAGEAGPQLVILPGLDTIDASIVETDFVEHSYFGDSRSVLFDIFELFKSRLAPGDRFGLEKRTNPAGLYWAFRPYTPH